MLMLWLHWRQRAPSAMARRVVAHLDEAREVAAHLRWRHRDLLPARRLVEARHVVLEALGDDGAVDDRQLLELLAAQARQPAIDRARRTPAEAGRLDDRRRAGDEVAHGEDTVAGGPEGVGVDGDVAAVELERQEFIGRPLGSFGVVPFRGSVRHDESDRPRRRCGYP